MSDDEKLEHVERMLVQRAIAGSLRDLPVTTSPIAIAMGARIASAGDGKVTMVFRISTQWTQGNGVVQGGIVSAMLDQGMVFAAFSCVPRTATVSTISQTTHFLRPVMPGEMRVSAELDRAGRRVMHTRAQLYDPAGELCAVAMSVLAVINRASAD